MVVVGALVSGDAVFSLGCRVLGCKAKTLVRAVRRPERPTATVEVSALVCERAWVLMFRPRDDDPKTLLIGALCPEHATIWNDAPETAERKDEGI